MSSISIGTCDYNVIIQIGSLKNLDLSSIGLYFLRVNLSIVSKESIISHNALPEVLRNSTNKSVIPINHSYNFHNKMNYSTKCSNITIDCPILTHEDIDYEESIYSNATTSSFRSRVFLIRYRNEIHDLNCQAMWNFQLKNIEINDSELPRLKDHVFVMTFELLHAPFLTKDINSLDLIEDIDKLLKCPKNYSIIATQYLIPQNLGNGFHEYFPITFKQPNCLLLDCSIYCYSNSIITSTSTSGKLQPMKLIKQLIDKELLIHNQNINTSKETTESISHYSRDNILEHLDSSYGKLDAWDVKNINLDLDEDEDGLAYHDAKSSTPSPMKYIKPPLKSMSPIIINKPSKYNVNTTSIIQRLDYDTSNLIQSYDINKYCNQMCHQHKETIRSLLYVLASCKHQNNVEEFFQLLNTFIDKIPSNKEIQNIWIQFYFLLPNIYEDVMIQLKHDYDMRMMNYWKRQVVVHSCQVSTNMLPPNDMNEDHILKRMIELIETEDLSRTTSPLARGLPICDMQGHLNVSKLPIMIAQQYNFDILTEELAIRGGSLVSEQKTLMINRNLLSRSNRLDIIELLHKTPKMTRQTILQENVALHHASGDFKRLQSHPSIGLLDCSSESDDDEDKDQSFISTYTNVIILVHGFQGCSNDMRLLANTIQTVLPQNTIVLCAKSNDRHNEDSIQTMAHRLIEEVLEFCRGLYHLPYCLRHLTSLLITLLDQVSDIFLNDMEAIDSSKIRISFICHSMGGLVVRKALDNPAFLPLMPYLHMYVSLATPHVGCVGLFNESHLISAGMSIMGYFIRSGKGNPIKELSLEDKHHQYSSKAISNSSHNNQHAINQSLLFQLSESQNFSFFKYYVFVSSKQDSYVPSYSARVQLFPKVTENPKTSEISTMIKNILSSIDMQRIYRFYLFDKDMQSEVTVDNLLGRKAHIMYLENPLVANLLIYTLLPFFIQ